MGVRQRAWRTASAAFVIVGAVALFWSAQQDRIWWVLAGFLVGMTSLSLLLLRVGDAIEDWLVDHQPPWVPWAFGAVAAGGLGAVVIVIVRQWPPAAAIAAVIVMTVGIIGLFQWTDRSPVVAGVGASPTPEDPEPPARIGIGSATWYGFEAMAAAIGLYLISDGTTTLIGAVLWLSGLVTVKIASIRWLGTRGEDLGRTMRALVDVALLGIFVMFAGAFGSNTVFVLLGLSVASAALSMIGVGAPHLESAHRVRWWAIGGSVALMVIVWAWMAVVTQNPGLAFVLGLMIALVGGFFVLRGEGIVLLMLAGFILAWGLVDRSVTIAETVPPVAGEPVRIVALGDSFISGEGALEFFEGTNEAGGNQCRRAPTAHPFLVAQALETNVVSFACSGAKIADLTTCGQMWPDGRRCRVRPESDTVDLDTVDGDNPDGDKPGDDNPDDDNPDDDNPDDDDPGDDDPGDDDSGGDVVDEPGALNPLVAVWRDGIEDDMGRPPGALPQLVTAAAQNATEAAEVVLLSIGGNDVGFSSIVKACLLPKGCEERRAVWLETIDLLGPQLDDVYVEIRRAFPDAAVLVMPYPMLVNAERRTSCDLGLSQEEREFVVDFIEKLDLTISEAADRAGFVFVEDAVGAYADEGAQLCDRPAAANHLKLVPPAGGKLARYSPATWIPGSMHPNVLGHELTAAATVCPVADALGRTPVSGVVGDDQAFSCDTATAVPDDEGAVGVGGEGASTACEAALAGDGPVDEEQAAACAAVADAVDQQLDELAAGVALATEDLVSDDEWIRIELFRTVRALALPLVLLLAAGMIFAWGFVQLNNPLSRFLSQERRGELG